MRANRPAGASAVALLAAVAMLAAMPSFAGSSPVCGDVNASGALTSGDALLVLKAAVGQQVDLQCPVVSMPLRTGQESCFDAAGVEQPCEGTGQDGEFRVGAPRDFVDNGDGTVTDRGTGLVWEKLSDDGSIHDKDDVYAWSAAFSGKIAALNASAFAGHDDWRLPNIRELETIADYARYSPGFVSPLSENCEPGCSAIDCGCVLQDGTTWSSTSYADEPMLAWGLFHPNAASTILYKGEAVLSVRAVRGGR